MLYVCHHADFHRFGSPGQERSEKFGCWPVHVFGRIDAAGRCPSRGWSSRGENWASAAKDFLFFCFKIASSRHLASGFERSGFVRARCAIDGVVRYAQRRKISENHETFVSGRVVDGNKPDAQDRGLLA
jgi:hypothetical protein